MMDRAAIYRRILVRETHVSRSAATVITQLTLAVIFAAVAVGAALLLTNKIDVRFAINDVTQSLPGAGYLWVFVVAAIVLVIVGILLVVKAFKRKHRMRHVLQNDRAAVVIDNPVIASALVRQAAGSVNLSPDQASAHVDNHRATVTLHPQAGMVVDGGAVTQSLEAQLATYDLQPRLRVKTEIKAGEKK